MAARPTILVPPERPLAGHAAPHAGAAGGDCCAGVWRFASADATAWETIEVESGDAVGPIIAAALGGPRRGPLVLALPSSWCLAAVISTTGLRGHDRQAMLYRLEERLPFAAEAVVAAFVPASESSALGVCVRADQVRPVVEALESAELAVASISPLALLMAVGTPTPAAPVGAVRVLICGSSAETGQVDLIALDGRTPVAWSLANTSDLARRVGWFSAGLGDDLRHEILAPEHIGQAALAAIGGANPAVHQMSAAGAAVAGATWLATSSRINLRRDALAPADRLRPYRGSVRGIAAAALVLLSSVAAAAFIRADRHNEAAEQAEAQILAEVQSAYPSSPGSAEKVRTLLAQERRSWANAKLAGTGVGPGGSTAGRPAAPHALSALRTLRDVVTRVPPDAGVQIDQSTFAETSFELIGRARSYDDLDKLAAAMRGGNLEVSSPVARRGRDGTWNFTMKGTTAASAAAR